MKFKLDENFPVFAAVLIRKAGHDCSTVYDQRISGCSDRELARICKAEGRCLVTFDLDFANPLVFRPSDHAGIAVFRLSASPVPPEIEGTVKPFLEAVRDRPLTGKLWILEPGRLREYQEDNNE